jgi:hypothetical protein
MDKKKNKIMKLEPENADDAASDLEKTKNNKQRRKPTATITASTSEDTSLVPSISKRSKPVKKTKDSSDESITIIKPDKRSQSTKKKLNNDKSDSGTTSRSTGEKKRKNKKRAVASIESEDDDILLQQRRTKSVKSKVILGAKYEESTIKVDLEAASTKIAFEILDKLTTSVEIEFTAKGFSITGISDGSPEPKKSKRKKGKLPKKANQVYYFFDASEMGDYNYILRDIHSVAMPSYKIEVYAKDFLDNLKNLKKQKLSFSIHIKSNGTNTGIHIHLTSSGGIKHIPTAEIKRQKNYINYYRKYYLDAQPRARPYTAVFLDAITSCKQVGCSDVEFVLNKTTGKMFLYGFKTGKEKPVVAQPLSNDEDDDDNESEARDELRCSINILECVWLTKIPKLCTTAVLKIHMKEDCPLVLITKIGSQGEAIFTFQHNS